MYLSEGLSVILGFIGIKLVLEALHTNEVPFINGGRGVTWAPEIPIWLSMTVIVGTLAVATAASLVSTGRRTRANARLSLAAREPRDPAATDGDRP